MRGENRRKAKGKPASRRVKPNGETGIPEKRRWEAETKKRRGKRRPKGLPRLFGREVHLPAGKPRANKIYNGRCR